LSFYCWEDLRSLFLFSGKACVPMKWGPRSSCRFVSTLQ
jgi:hypothetical protein